MIDQVRNGRAFKCSRVFATVVGCPMLHGFMLVSNHAYDSLGNRSYILWDFILGTILSNKRAHAHLSQCDVVMSWRDCRTGWTEGAQELENVLSLLEVQLT